MVFPDDDRNVRHARFLQADAFDFAQFDPIAPHLDLMVRTPQVFELAVFQLAHQVARAVEPRARFPAEAVGQEFFGREPRPLQVAARHADPADVEFADHAPRDHLAAVAQHVELGVGHRPPYRFDPLRLAQGEAGVGGAFGRAVEVVDPADAGFGVQAVHQRALERFSRQVEHLDRGREGLAFEQRLGRRGDGVDQGDVAFAGLVERLQREDVVDQDAALAGRQGQEHFVDGEVEAEGGAGQDAGAARFGQHGRGPVQEREGALVRDADAFGPACAAGGVDHVGQLRRRDGPLRVVFGCVVCFTLCFTLCFGLCTVQAVVVHAQAFCGVDREPGLQRRGREDPCRAGIAKQGLHPGGRVGGVDGDVAAAGFQYAKQAGDAVGRARQADADARFGREFPCQQHMGQPVGPFVQFPVADGLGAGPQGDALRMPRRLLFEQAVQGLAVGVLLPGVVPVFQQLLPFGRRQDVDALGRRVGRLFQRPHQVLQRAVHVVAHPLRRHRRADLRRQHEACRVVVHREHDRVVGPLFSSQRLHAAPGRGVLFAWCVALCFTWCVALRFSGRAAVAVVEQGREQRHRGRHAAAALRQRQRCVFVPQQLRQPAMHVAYALFHAGAAYPHPDGQGVDEQAHDAIRPRSCLHPPEQDGAEYDVLPAR